MTICSTLTLLESTKIEKSTQLWEMLLLYSFQNTDETVKKMKKLFSDQYGKFEVMVDTMFGLDRDDMNKSHFTMELGTDIMLLEQRARTYTEQVKQHEELIELAWNMPRVHSGLNGMMRDLLQSTFANSLHDMICDLGHVKRLLHTILRIARTDPTFKNIKICLGEPPSITSSTSSVAQKANKPRSLPNMAPQSPVMTPPLPPQNPSLDIFESIKPYLSKEDQECGLHTLQSAAKQDAAILVAFVVRGVVPHPATAAHYHFGFVVCPDRVAENALVSTYYRFLNREQGKAANFQDLVQALEAYKLPLLPDADSHHNTLVMPRSVKDFLFARPHERPSVWRLIQFLRDNDNDEPPPCVKRDYGFKLCSQREHVTALKNLYTAILRKTTPMRLHSACEDGGLLRFASKIVVIEPKMHRFLHNDDSNPGIGFDNDVGLDAYMLPLFKRSSKG